MVTLRSLSGARGRDAIAVRRRFELTKVIYPWTAAPLRGLLFSFDLHVFWRRRVRRRDIFVLGEWEVGSLGSEMASVLRIKKHLDRRGLIAAN